MTAVHMQIKRHSLHLLVDTVGAPTIQIIIQLTLNSGYPPPMSEQSKTRARDAVKEVPEGQVGYHMCFFLSSRDLDD